MKPKDLIAIMCVAGYFTSKALGFDGVVDTAFMLILGYYFVKRQEHKDNGL